MFSKSVSKLSGESDQTTRRSAALQFAYVAQKYTRFTKYG